jgi:hypothetical protein
VNTEPTVWSGLKPTQASRWFFQKPGVQPSLPGGVVVDGGVVVVVVVDGVVVGGVVVDGVVVGGVEDDELDDEDDELDAEDDVVVPPAASPTCPNRVARNTQATTITGPRNFASRRLRALIASPLANLSQHGLDRISRMIWADKKLAQEFRLANEPPRLRRKVA